MGGEDTTRVHDDAKAVQLGAMQPAASFRAFSEQPLGHCITGDAFVYGWPTSELCVTAMWGQPKPADLELLAKLYALELAPPAMPHAAVIDTVRVESVSSQAYEVIAEYVRARRDGLAEFVTRLAIVHGEGFAGAVAAGFYETMQAPYPVQMFASVSEALAWCEGPTWVENDLARWTTDADLPDLVRNLRRAIEASLPNVEIEKAAGALGLTVRTLQRRLKEHDTTFRQQVALTQVRVAKRWLEETDESVTRIAFEVGCSTPQHLSTLFRQHAQSTPSAWRAARKEETET